MLSSSSTKRFFVLIFLFLYFYNFVGYLAVFGVLQYRVKSEVRRMLLASVPESELVRLRFATVSLFGEDSPVQWLEPTEFRYCGGMYDVARILVETDTTTIYALRDDQEEQLFAGFDKHVHRHMGASAAQARLDHFQEVFKDSFIGNAPELSGIASSGLFVEAVCLLYVPITLDIPSPPPRDLFISTRA